MGVQNVGNRLRLIVAVTAVPHPAQCVSLWIKPMTGEGITPSQTSTNVNVARITPSKNEKPDLG